MYRRQSESQKVEEVITIPDMRTSMTALSAKAAAE